MGHVVQYPVSHTGQPDVPRKFHKQRVKEAGAFSHQLVCPEIDWIGSFQI